MKRLHLHIGVEQLEEAVQFYTKLLGAKPVKRKPDYAKWHVKRSLREPSHFHANSHERC